MQSTFQLIFSGCTGIMLVLASCVLVAPLLAVLVALACVGSAWVLLQIDRLLEAARRFEATIDERRLNLSDGREDRQP